VRYKSSRYSDSASHDNFLMFVRTFDGLVRSEASFCGQLQIRPVTAQTITDASQRWFLCGDRALSADPATAVLPSSLHSCCGPAQSLRNSRKATCV
jgi:hypothetical protein